ncbi:MAG: DUF1761 family protein [Cyclobacteriaceae bacterium]|nr:DUF1761 family protein [Cyclobacteriaceae bacterium]
MDAKKRMLATLVGFVVLFVLGWIFYGMLLMDFYMANSGSASGVHRADDDMVWWALIVGNIMQAYLLVYIFGKWANISTFSGGVMAGGTIGFIYGLAYSLIMYSTSNLYNLTATLVDPFVAGIMMGITGGVIGWMLGRK